MLLLPRASCMRERWVTAHLRRILVSDSTKVRRRWVATHLRRTLVSDPLSVIHEWCVIATFCLMSTSHLFSDGMPRALAPECPPVHDRGHTAACPLRSASVQRSTDVEMRMALRRAPAPSRSTIMFKHFKILLVCVGLCSVVQSQDPQTQSCLQCLNRQRLRS